MAELEKQRSMLRSIESSSSSLSMLVMSLAGHNCVSVRNKISLFIRRESEALSLAWLFNDLVLIYVKTTNYKKEQLALK